MQAPSAPVGDPSTLWGLLEAAAERWPTAPALDAQGCTWRYEELAAAVDRAAGLLARRGVRPGDRIAVALGHGAAHFAVPFVASRLGVSALLLNSSLAPERWARQLATTRPRLVVGDAAHDGRLAGADAEVHAVDGDDPSLGAEGSPGLVSDGGHGPDDVVLHLGTSGTTGVPKVTCLTERGLLHAARGYLPHLPLAEDERSLVVMPLSYIGPITAQSVLMPLVGGCTVVADDPRPGPAADRMAVERITHLDAIPAWLRRFAPRLHRPPRAWRSVIYGGAPMPPATAAALAERAPGVELFDVWGLSEVHGPLTLRRHDPERPPEPGVVGRPLDGLTVRALPVGEPPCGEPSAVPSHGVGELWVTGPSVFAGYLDDREATAAALRDGWLATGDLGRVQRDGAVRLLGRRKDVILRGGANVFSVEVEQVLAAEPGIADAAVFAVPDATAGEVVGAALVPAAGGVDVAALRRAVRRRIGTHAVPRHIELVDELPRNRTGKVDKEELRRRLGIPGADLDSGV